MSPRFQLVKKNLKTAHPLTSSPDIHILLSNATLTGSLTRSHRNFATSIERNHSPPPSNATSTRNQPGRCSWLGLFVSVLPLARSLSLLLLLLLLHLHLKGPGNQPRLTLVQLGKN